MASSPEAARQELLDAVGIDDVADLFAQIPADHRLARPLALAPGVTSELELRRHVAELLARSLPADRTLSFLGAGCYRRFVPAVVDEIVRRTEFVTPVWGSTMSEHGKCQAWFEYQSQLGELVDMDFVGLPVYSYGYAAGHALRMAARLTGRREVLIARSVDPERRSVISNLGGTALDLVDVPFDPSLGTLDLDVLDRALSSATAAVYLESPNGLGLLERDAPAIAERARAIGAETVVGVDPSSLGVLRPPGDYGADIVVGSLQPLGVHMLAGGGLSGFIATRDDARYAHEYPTLLLSITTTANESEHGFGVTLFEQSSYAARDDGKDWTGTSTYLWAIAAATYMALLGPQGFAELGRVTLQQTHYAARRIAEVPGVRVAFPSGFYNEFVVDLGGSGRTVAELHEALLARQIVGGRDLSEDFPELGQAALYCVSELHTRADLDRLVDAIRAEVVR